jgi:AcrR family transcriptional regulator
VTAIAKREKDRRIERTENLLREALVALIHERSYEAITVREILERANVGRSTFYAHFRDKDELLTSGIQQMLRLARSVAPSTSPKQSERIIWFSLPILTYHHRHRSVGDVRMGARGRAVVHEHLRRLLAELIGDYLKKELQEQRRGTSRIPPDLVVQYVATTFVLVLNWWVESRSSLRANDVNNLFRAMVLPTLDATLG